MSNNKKAIKAHKQGQSKKNEEPSSDTYALELAESLISQVQNENNSEAYVTKLCDTVRKLGGILITYESDLQTVQSSQKMKNTNNASIKQNTVCFSVSKIGDLLRSDPPKEVQLEVIQLVKSLASKENLNFLLRQLGLMNELNPYLNSTDGNIINEAAQAIDALKKTAEDSVQKFGFGYRKEDGTFSTIAVIMQDNYHNVGMAWKIWDAAIYLTQWIYDNSDLFVGKKVLELGSGCGLCGIIAAMFADTVVLSDYLLQIDKFLKENIKANAKLTRNLPTTAIIDWTSDCVVQHPILKKGVDVIIGADIFFQPQLAHHLAKCVNMYLGNKGVFYGCSGSRRQGVQQFIASLKDLGYQVETQLPGNLENVHPDDDEMFFFYCYKKE